MDLARIQQRPENRAREIAAVAPEGRLHATAVGGDVPGDDEGSGEVRRHEVLEAGMRIGPLNARPQRTPLHHDDAPRVDPLHRARPAAALLQEAMKQLGGPDLPVAGDQVAHIARGRAGELHGLQDPRQIVTVAVEAGEVQPRRLTCEQRLRDGRVSRPQRSEIGPEGVVLALGQVHEPQERIGDAPASGQDDAHALVRQGIENGGDAPEAVGVGDARPSELVHDPGIGFGHRYVNLGAAVAKMPRDSTDALQSTQ